MHSVAAIGNKILINTILGSCFLQQKAIWRGELGQLPGHTGGKSRIEACHLVDGDLHSVNDILVFIPAINGKT
jgi:hypothetical protein